MRESVQSLRGKRELALGEETEGRKEGAGALSRSLPLMGEQGSPLGREGRRERGRAQEGKGGRSHSGKEQRHGVQSWEDGQV